MNEYFIRIGVLGEIRPATAMMPLRRGQRVVVRSPRGVEVAEVLSQRGSVDGNAAQGNATPAPTVFRIVRPTSQTDELLVERLLRYKCEAIEECRQRLARSGSPATLLDVDQMLDGGTLLMHFAGEIDSVGQSIADEIATHYEELVQTHHLSELLTEGCGPECGTSNGCGSACGSCSGCGLG